MPDVSEAVLDGIKQQLVAMSKTWEAGVCKGKAYKLDGTSLGGEHTACHSWVSSAFQKMCWGPYHYAYDRTPKPKGPIYDTSKGWFQDWRDDAKDFLVATCHSKVRSKHVCSVEAHEAIILWLASDESPFSQFILNRDDRDSLLNGGAIILCGPNGASCSQAMWICKVLRYGVEGAKALDVWHKLYLGGVDPILAVLVATHIRTVKGATFGYTGPEAHSTVFSRAAKTDVPRLLKREFNPESQSTSDVFIPQKGAVETTLPFQKLLKPVKKDDGWGGTVDGVACGMDEFVEQVKAWQEEMGLKAADLPPVVVPPPKPVAKPWTPNRNTEFLELDM